MKKSEFLTFNIQIYPYDSKDGNPSSVQLYFNEQLIIKQSIFKYDKMLRFSFFKECVFFKKHQLSIIGANDYKLKIIQLQIHSAKFNNFEEQQFIIYKKINDQIHTFEFESPYVYYFLNRI